MISIASEDGRLLRILPEWTGRIHFGFHRQLGLVSCITAAKRLANRKKYGLMKKDEWLCKFDLVSGANSNIQVVPVSGCTAEMDQDKSWSLSSPSGTFVISTNTAEIPPYISMRADKKNQDRITPGIATILTLLILTLLWFPRAEEEVAEVEEERTVLVKIVKPRNSVAVPIPRALKGVKRVAKKKTEENKLRRAVRQNLGFLGVLGQKNLKKALGGTPSKLKDASPGAGSGGSAGSGGELLVGIGKGIRKTTVGNTGTVGLGGIGTQGKGGGLGGYGNAAVSGGTGGALNIPLANDVLMEGGLSQSVIQATIAKYLAQIRACYEMGLRKNPGLSGTVSTRFEIGATGSMNYSKVTRSSLGDTRVEECMMRRMRSWRFPKPKGGVKVRVNYPFLLRPLRT